MYPDDENELYRNYTKEKKKTVFIITALVSCSPNTKDPSGAVRQISHCSLSTKTIKKINVLFDCIGNTNREDWSKRFSLQCVSS